MAKFSSTRPGVPQEDTSRVDDVPLIEGAAVPLPSEGMPVSDPYAEYAQMAEQDAAQRYTQDVVQATRTPQVDLGEVETTPLPSIDEATFDQRLMQAAGMTPEQQAQATQASAAMMQRPFFTNTGEEIIDPAQKMSIMAQEAQQTREALKRKGNVDYTSYSDMSQNFDKIVHESDLGKVQSVAKDATLTLNKIGVARNTESTTGLNMLTNMFQTDNKEAIGGFVNAASAVSMEVMSGKLNKDLQAQVAEDNAGVMQNEDDLFAGLSSAEISGVQEDPINISNGMKAKNFESRLAAAYKTYMKNAKLSTGEDPSVAQKANSDLLGPTLKDVAMDSGLFKEINGNDGETYIIPTNKAMEFSKATKGLVEETISERKALRRPKTPANADSGWYNTWNKSKDIRNKFIPRYQNTSLETKYKSPNKKRGSLQDISDFSVKVGSVPYASNKYQIGGLALITSMAMNPQNPYADTLKEFISLDASRLANIAKEAGGGNKGQRAADQERLKTVNKLNRSLGDYAQITLSGPEYNYHKADPTVWRWYPENLSVEMQNNLFNRALGSNPVANPVKVSREDLRAIPSMGEASKKWFMKHFKDGGRIKDKRMAIISNLVAAHKNIMGKASESMTWEERVSQVTPQFIAEHGNTGRLLKSAIDKLNIIKPDGTIDAQALSNFSLQVDRQTQQIAPLPNIELSADELGAVAKWINNSDKKTFGFSLSAYIGLADLISSVQNETYWDPKIMTDMDMNSAGRTFLAMDIGDEGVLTRTGIVFNHVDKLMGGPRKLFYLQMDKLLDNKFNDYNIGKLFPNSTATTDAEKKSIASAMQKQFNELSARYPEFYDDLAKKVLLKDDYGKHFAFHHDDARSFLFKPKYATLKESLQPFYKDDQDMVKDMAHLYSQTILTNSELWNKELPKDIVEYLQFFGRFPEPTLYFGEKAAIGSESYKEVEDGVSTFITTSDGRQIEVKQKEKYLDPTKRGQAKRVYDADTDTHRHFDPEYNTYNQNLIGPLLGQYRESATLIDAVNMVNPDKTKNPHWFAIVHDNLIVDGNGFAPYFFGVNSVAEGSARKILGFNMMGEFVQDFRRQYDDIINEMRKEIAEKGKEGAILDIGTEGKNAAIGRRADTVYQRLKAMDEDVYTRKFLESELELYKNIGWRSPDDRAGDLKTYPIKLVNVLQKVNKPTRRNKFTGKEETATNPMNFIEAWFYIRNMSDKMNQFITPDGSYVKDSAQDKKNKQLGEIDRLQELFYFFT